MTPEQKGELLRIQETALLLGSLITEYTRTYREQLDIRQTRLVEDGQLLLRVGVEVK